MTDERIELLDLICAKWTHLILVVLHEMSHRFGDLKNSIPRISTKMLPQQ